MKQHLPMACGKSKINHSVFWTFEVLYNPLNIIGSLFLYDCLFEDTKLNNSLLPLFLRAHEETFYCVLPCSLCLPAGERGI